jgi:hypothetical protein
MEAAGIDRLILADIDPPDPDAIAVTRPNAR